MRKAIFILSVFLMAFASFAYAQDNPAPTAAGEQVKADPASKAKKFDWSKGYMDLIPAPKFYLSNREPYLSRYFSIEPSIGVGGYLFAPGQIYSPTWWLAARLGVLLPFGLEGEFSFGGSQVHVNSKAAEDSLAPDVGVESEAINIDTLIGNPQMNRAFFAWHAAALWHPVEFPQWHSGWGSLIPYGQLGFGGTITFPPLVTYPDGSIAGGGRDYDPTFGAGLGFKYLLPWWDFVGIRGDIYSSLIAGFGKSPFDNGSQAGNINTEMTLGVFGNVDWIGILSPTKKKVPTGPKDTDGDGVIDTEDKCPEKIGPPSNEGCPLELTKIETPTDKDGDTVTDDKDECPDEAGKPELKGCPDRDGDGIADKDDECPDEKGDVPLKGCPDRDGDGIIDSKDKCPDKAEDINNYEDDDGCPEGGKEAVEKKEVIQKYSGTLEGIEFVTGQATLKPTSKPKLDEVAEKFVKFPTLKAGIVGYTDNRGSAAVNTKLSQRRAETVRTYLIGKGVKADNLKAKGCGPLDAKLEKQLADTGCTPKNPIADNKTPKGREANRRIEFHIEE